MSADRRSSVPTPASGTSSLPPGFTDEVMIAIDQAPRPSPGRAFWYAVRDRSIADARGALIVAWRIIRRSTSMPVMVRAQALALVVVVAGSMVGGGAMAAVVAYQAVAPIVHAISEPPGDRARTVHEDVRTAPLETPSTVELVEPEVGGPDRPPTRPATTDGSNLPGDRADDDGADVDEADDDGADTGATDGADVDEADDDGADTGATDGADADETDGGEPDGTDGGEPDGTDGADQGGDPDEVESP